MGSPARAHFLPFAVTAFTFGAAGALAFATFWPLAGPCACALVAVLALALCSFRAASFAAARISTFCDFFFLMSSSDMPTMAFCTFVARFVRFFPASSALPFLFFRRQFSVHVSFTGLIFWRKSEYILWQMKMLTLPSFAAYLIPRPG